MQNAKLKADYVVGFFNIIYILIHHFVVPLPFLREG